jgi:hypothetical protein
MTPHEITSHKDFATLVQSAVTRFKIYTSLSTEELTQEVALNILRLKHPPDNLSMTTIVYKHTCWVSMRIKKQKMHAPLHAAGNVSHAEKTSRETYQEIANLFAKATNQQAKIIQGILSGKSVAELSEETGVSRSSIYQSIKDLNDGKTVD